MVSSEEQDTERVGGASASGARVQKKRPAERPPSNVESEDEGAPVEKTLPGAKKKRRPTPIRVNLEPPALEGGEPGSFDLSDRQVVDKPNGRYNKNGVVRPRGGAGPHPPLVSRVPPSATVSSFRNVRMCPRAPSPGIPSPRR